MPISLKVLPPRPMEIGKIKIGMLGEERQKRSGKGTYQAPQKIDHFLVTSMDRGNDGNFKLDEPMMRALRAYNGLNPEDTNGKVKRIPIIVHSDNIEEVFPTTLAAYMGQKLYCRGSGEGEADRYEVAEKRENGSVYYERTGEVSKVPCSCDLLGADGKMTCKPHGTLFCTIAAGDETTIGGMHTFRTTSWNMISGITAGLPQIQSMIGTLIQVPLELRIVTRMVIPKGQSRPQKINLVVVTCTSKDVRQLSEAALQSAALRARVSRSYSRAVIGPGIDEDEDTQAAIAAEYHPDTDVIDMPSDDPPQLPPAPDQGAQQDGPPVPQGHPSRDAVLGSISELSGIDGSDNKDVKMQILNGSLRDLGIGRKWHKLTSEDIERLLGHLTEKLKRRELVKGRIAQLARMDGCSDEDVKSAILKESIKALKIGRQWHELTSEDIDSLLKYTAEEIAKRERGAG